MKKIIIGIFAVVLFFVVLGGLKQEKTNLNERKAEKARTIIPQKKTETNSETNPSPSVTNKDTDSLLPEVTSTLRANSLPKAPAGYTWYECKNMKSHFLKPTGWYTKEETKVDTQACFITKEMIVPGGMFQTGLTVNAVPNIPKKTGGSASKYAEAFFTKAKQTMKTSEVKIATQGPFKVWSAALYPTNNDIVIYQMVAANDTTGSIYVITFESPTDQWEEASKVGETIIMNMAMNMEF